MWTRGTATTPCRLQIQSFCPDRKIFSIYPGAIVCEQGLVAVPSWGRRNYRKKNKRGPTSLVCTSIFIEIKIFSENRDRSDELTRRKTVPRPGWLKDRLAAPRRASCPSSTIRWVPCNFGIFGAQKVGPLVNILRGKNHKTIQSVPNLSSASNRSVLYFRAQKLSVFTISPPPKNQVL